MAVSLSSNLSISYLLPKLFSSTIREPNRLGGKLNSFYREIVNLRKIKSSHSSCHLAISHSTMTVQLNTKSLDKLEEESSKSVHYLPCKIQANCKAKVSQHFSRFIEGKDDEIQEVSFRGRPFIGKVINLPDSYQGVVFLETMKPKSLKADRKFHAIRSFQSFTYWNWDKVPSRNDAFLGAMDWLDISKAVHSPVEEPKYENGEGSEELTCNGVVKKEEMNGDAMESSEATAETAPVANNINNNADDMS